MTISSETDYVYIICPRCATDTNLAAQPTCEKCGYEVPYAFFIPPDAKWDYEPELVKILKSHDNLRIMGRYAGEHPEKLKELNHCKYLYLSKYKGFKFDYFEDYNQLEVLELSELSIKNLKHVDHAINLQSLSIIDCDEFESTEGIATLNSLKILDITTDSNVKNFAGVQALSELIYFRYEGKSMESIGFLAGLKDLTIVVLPTKVLDKNLDPMLGLPKLEELYIKKSSFNKATIQKFSQARPDCKLVLW